MSYLSDKITSTKRDVQILEETQKAVRDIVKDYGSEFD